MIKMPAGDELNILVHHKVMGIVWDTTRCRICGWELQETIDQGCTVFGCSQRPAPSRRADAPPPYSADWNCIKPIAEKLRAEGFVLRTTMSMDGFGATFHRGWETSVISGLTVTSYAADLAHAVCLAALLAKGYKP